LSVYFIIFAAAVLPDGTASGSLARRVEGALALARGALESVLFCHAILSARADGAMARPSPWWRAISCSPAAPRRTRS
jgi:hypothetical protein